MLYDPPSNVTSSVGMFQWINNVVSVNGEGMFFVLIILATFIIILAKQVTASGNTIGKAWASSSFICFILSVFASLMGFVSTYVVIIFVIFTAGGGVWMHVENN